MVYFYFTSRKIKTLTQYSPRSPAEKLVEVEVHFQLVDKNMAEAVFASPPHGLIIVWTDGENAR